MTVRTCVVLIAVFAASCTAAEPTTTTTTTTEPSLYALPPSKTTDAWVEDAMDYVESVGWDFSDHSRVRRDLWVEARDACSSLAGGVPPLVVQSTYRDAATNIEQWEAYGAALWDSLLNGLCVDH